MSAQQVASKIVWKPYMDYEKEEAWLNDMAAQGWDLAKYTWMRYRFEKGEPGEYTYRIQLLPEWAGSRKSKEYLDFMRESGVEVVCTYSSWAYFRKRAAEGPFELFSDLDSMIAHQKRVAWMFGLFAIVLLPTEISLLSGDMVDRYVWLIPLGVLEFVLSVVLGAVALRAFGRIRSLERQRQVHE